jgi:hypothetical protein
MADVEQRPAPVPEGAEFAYDEAVRKLSEQLHAITDLDTKLGIAIGLLAAVIAALVSQHLPLLVQGPVSIWLLVALVQGSRAFLFDRYSDAPVARALAERYADRPPAAMKWAALPSVLAAMDLNEPKLFEKGLFLNQLVVTVAAVAVVVLLAKALSLA